MGRPISLLMHRLCTPGAHTGVSLYVSTPATHISNVGFLHFLQRPQDPFGGTRQFPIVLMGKREHPEVDDPGRDETVYIEKRLQ